MDERKTVSFKKEEYSMKERIKNNLGKGKVSAVNIIYTPVGEKIVISTNKPGLVIGRKGEKINELTRMLKKEFKLENPHIEIKEILHPEFDAQFMADDIALSLERFGPLKFKVVSYRALQRIVKAGALGVELRISGKLPGSRAKSWRFAHGYLKKTGDSAKVVNKAQARAETKPGTVGVKVSIMPPDAKLVDRINITEELVKELKNNSEKAKMPEVKLTIKKKVTKKKSVKKTKEAKK